VLYKRSGAISPVFSLFLPVFSKKHHLLKNFFDFDEKKA
jgi:hypothetical protein